MIDGKGRCIDYLRISVTDRCNLRCIYCMPREGVPKTTHANILSYDEIVRIVRIMAGMGLKKVRLTGGEPLTRKNITALIRELKAIPGIEKVTLTTNGVLLGQMLPQLEEAGLDGVNISLDTMNPELYYKITRNDMLSTVLDGISRTILSGRISVKINCVPMRLVGQNPTAIAGYAKDYPVHVRYIEMMPIGLGKNFLRVGEEEIRRELSEKYGELTLYEGRIGNGPCSYYDVPGFRGKIGFISAISHRFCEECNRVRLTSEGFLKACLQYDTGEDLRDLLRDGSSDEAIAEMIQKALDRKPEGHRFENYGTGSDGCPGGGNLSKDGCSGCRGMEDPENSLIMSQIGG